MTNFRDFICPECKQKLKEVKQSQHSYLNSEQFDASKAGDWMCPNPKCPGIKKIHPDKLANNGHRCYWLHELLSPQEDN